MGDRGFLVDPVAEVEYVRAVGEGFENPRHPLLERLAAGEQQQRIEVALHHQASR